MHRLALENSRFLDGISFTYSTGRAPNHVYKLPNAKLPDVCIYPIRVLDRVIANSNYEIRNSKQYSMTEFQMTKSISCVNPKLAWSRNYFFLSLEHSNFEFVSDFDIRIWCNLVPSFSGLAFSTRMCLENAVLRM